MTLTAEELTLRQGRIGASMVGAIVGVNPFAGPIDAWLQLTGRAVKEQTDDGKLRTDWGGQMEGMLASWYEHETGLELAPCTTLIHPRHDWAIATPDRTANAPLLVECKHVGERVAWHWMDGPPDYVAAQCVWQMLVTRALGMDVSRVDVVADVGGAPPEIFPVQYDADLENNMFEAVERFWVDHVVADVPPAVDGSASYQAWLRRQYPNSSGTMREAPEADQWATQYAEASEAIKAANDAKELAANNLRFAIGEDDGVRGPWGQATNRTSARGTRSLRVKLNGDTRVRRVGRATVEDIAI